MSDEWQEYLKDTRRICKYGTKCYQKNPEHQEKFKHPPKELKNKAGHKRNNARFSPYTDRKDTKKVQKPIEEGRKGCSSIEPSSSTSPDLLPVNNSKIEIFTKISINEDTKLFDKNPDNDIFKQCFLVGMPPDFFQFYNCLCSEDNSAEKLLATVNLQLIGPYDLLLGKLPIIEDKDLYLIHWRFFYDPPEFQSVIKKKGASEFHIGYFRDNPSEDPVFLAINDSEKDCTIKPIATNIFGAVHWYLQQEKKTSPFASIACQKLIDKINVWTKEHGYSLEEFDMKKRQAQTVCKSFHGAGIAVPYNKKTQLGYRSLAESNASLKKLFKQLEEVKTQKDKDNVLSDLQPVITWANIAVDECDFGTGLEAGIAMFCSGHKELESSALSSLSAVYPLLNREAFAKIIQVHMKHRRKGSDMSIFSE